MSTPSTKKGKPKSPPVPSKSLEDCMDDGRRLYKEYSHGSFSRSELASALKVSSRSGPFAQRLFSLRELGIIATDGSNFRVSDAFMAMHSNSTDSSAFKRAAVEAIRRSSTFREILDAFPTKLPSQEGVAGRLETQKKFNADRAKQAARVLEESLRYAGVLDGSGNILPVRDDGKTPPADEKPGSDQGEDDEVEGDGGASGTSTLRVEVPVGDRKVTVHYPRDLSADEAQKVGAVLAAIVS